MTNANAPTPCEKRRILRDFIELKIQHGYEISQYMGRPLSWFSFEAVKEEISKMENNPLH